MPNFQGSGFTIALPDNCVDASSYAFVLPEKDGLAANLTIRFESAKKISDLQAHVNESLEVFKTSVAEFKLLNQVAGKRGAHFGVMSDFEWGTGASRLRQRQYCVMTKGKKPRIYILSATDLASNADKSVRIFNQMMKTFLPNEEQLF